MYDVVAISDVGFVCLFYGLIKTNGTKIKLDEIRKYMQRIFRPEKLAIPKVYSCSVLKFHDHFHSLVE